MRATTRWWIGVAITLPFLCVGFYFASYITLPARLVAQCPITDGNGQPHVLRLFYAFGPLSLADHAFIKFGGKTWLMHRGGMGYGDGMVLLSPDENEAVVTYRFEGTAQIFVHLDVPTETSEPRDGWPSDYITKGWRVIPWQRIAQ